MQINEPVLCYLANRVHARSDADIRGVPKWEIERDLQKPGNTTTQGGITPIINRMR